MGVQRIRHGSVFPLLPFIGRVGAGAFHKRHKHRLVVVASEGGRFVVLDQRTLATTLTAGADFQRLWRFHHEGLIVDACSVSRHDRGRCFQWTGVSGVLAMVLIDRRRHRPRPESGRGFFLVPDGAAVCGMLGAKARRFHHAGRMVGLRPEGAGDTVRHIHAVSALIVQADAACRSSAFLRSSGSSLPRTEALRSIPRHAFGLK